MLALRVTFTCWRFGVLRCASAGGSLSGRLTAVLIRNLVARRWCCLAVLICGSAGMRASFEAAESC
eukprot:4324171-Pleurochrysis_carterae.AAC.1